MRALVTGGSSGVGLQIARALTAAGAEVVLPVRDRARGERAVTAIREDVPAARLTLCDLDLAGLGSVRECAAALAAGPPIDLVVLNAGVVLLGDPQRHVTEDGFELHFQTNFLGHAALVHGLLPLLRAWRTRVVVQSSLGSAFFGVRWDDLQLERRYGALRAYGSSKTALGLFACELARRESQLTVHVAHPGIVPATAIAPDARRRVYPGIRDFVVHHLGNPPADAALPALAAATTDAPAPAFFAPSGWLQVAGRRARQRRLFRRIVDAAAGRRIWDLTERLIASP
ncbi:MAG TPA: SDR family NAD(P)-dependent oxidoreductase [Microbacterium sp.]|nr:SDR family NAD(P)-dependent oxidoreductase [Microbacterium sp.]